MDELDIIITKHLFSLTKNKSLKDIIEDFPIIKKDILKILNDYTSKNNMNETEKQKFIEERYKNIKIKGLDIEKYDEELEYVKKKRIHDLVRHIEMEMDPGPMTKEEIDLVTKELIKRRKEEWELEKLIDDYKFNRIMDCFSNTKKDSDLDPKEIIKRNNEDWELEKLIDDYKFNRIMDCFTPRKK